MAEIEEINPLDISFSNGKGFQPSTPSQTSPTRGKYYNIHVKSPVELFESTPSRSILPQKSFTPPSKNIKVEISRFSSRKSENKKKEGSLTMTRSWIQDIQLLQESDKKRRELLKWQSMQYGQLREISRLDQLLSRVDKNISLYSRLHPKRRY